MIFGRSVHPELFYFGILSSYRSPVMRLAERFILKTLLERASKRNIDNYPPVRCVAHDNISRKIFIDGFFEKVELFALENLL